MWIPKYEGLCNEIAGVIETAGVFAMIVRGDVARGMAPGFNDEGDVK
ncbi:MAG: hypothetical protein ISN28_10560 [Ectothiorhodospiraceae bacterium AqS1]|nr:hypothetical protein [Ectothiorhodospiraceae bacterium AqS1]